jgi:hypothetical protein
MYSSIVYLVSGAIANTTGNAASVLGQDKFRATIHGLTTGAMPPTGNVGIDIRLDPSADWVNIYQNTYNGPSGIPITWDGPVESIRGFVNSRTAGMYTIVCRYSSSKG